jgi:hypothetical protein
MDPRLLDRFDDAQRRSIALTSKLLEGLRGGMSERSVARIATDLLPDFGFDRWFYPPEIQIGANTIRAGIWRPPSGSKRLRQGDPIMVALGPSDGQASGDVCATVTFGEPDSELIEASRDCTRATCGYASELKCVGELFIYARTWAANHRATLANPRSIGHALLPPDGRFPGYPRSAHMATWLRRYQVHFLNPRRLEGLWALGPQLSDQRSGARFREVVYVGPDTRRILGREGLDEIGRFDDR